MRLPLFFLICVQFTMAQNQLQSKLLDSTTKAPIEFADVYNHYNYTTSNADGSFLFTSESDSIFIKRLGYKPLRTTFEKLNNQKVIYLTEETFVLEEIVLTKQESIYDKINNNLEKNYPFSPFEERFTLRALLKKNDTILKLEDLSGKVKRQQLFGSKKHPMPKKNYEIELLNMRKAGLKEENIDFVFNNFHDIFHWYISIFTNRKHFNREIENLPNAIKINFKTKDSIRIANKGYTVEGYYMVNPEDMAIEEGLSTNYRPNVDYKKNGPYKSRTTYFKVHTFFNKYKNGKYSIRNSKIDFITEVLNTKTNKTDIYNCSYIITTQDNFKELNTIKNVSVNKDIFKLKYPYNPAFWNKQNELLLTEEMLEFLKTVNTEENEYRTVSNLK